MVRDKSYLNRLITAQIVRTFTVSYNTNKKEGCLIKQTQTIICYIDDRDP